MYVVPLYYGENNDNNNKKQLFASLFSVKCVCLLLSVSIDSIREVCEGKQSEIFQRYAEGSFDPNCCFTLYYGEHMESLDLVSGTGEEARTWITGLKYLMAGISDEDSLAKRQRTRDQYPFLEPRRARQCRERLGWWRLLFP